MFTSAFGVVGSDLQLVEEFARGFDAAHRGQALQTPRIVTAQRCLSSFIISTATFPRRWKFFAL